MLDLQPILDMVFEPGTKGLPLDCGPIRLGDIGAQGWRLYDDLQLPAAVIRRSALDANASWMQRFAQSAGVSLCPHGKTTMAPQIFDRQLRGGAWGLSCATIAHLQIYRRFGVQRIIYANQIPSAAAARWVVKELVRDPDFELLVFVDSVESAELMADAVRVEQLKRPVRVLIELGVAGARTGVRSSDAALLLARFVAGRPELALSGVATFEGVVAGGSDVGMEPNVRTLLAELVQIAERIARAGLFAAGEVILTAGGSRFFDLVAGTLKNAELAGYEKHVVLRSGCYVSHDARHYEAAFQRMLERSGQEACLPKERLQNALEVWATIQSRPEPSRIYATLGKRDISHDLELPVVLARADRQGAVHAVPPAQMTVTSLSDQHAHIAAASTAEGNVGDHLGFGVSHPCTTFDKWRLLFEIDQSDKVIGAIATFF